MEAAVKVPQRIRVLKRTITVCFRRPSKCALEVGAAGYVTKDRIAAS